MTIVPTEKWLFNVNIGYLDAKYTEINPGTFALDTNTAFAQAPEHTGSVRRAVQREPERGIVARDAARLSVPRPVLAFAAVPAHVVLGRRSRRASTRAAARAS